MITRWNPVRDVLSMREAMDRVFDDSFRSNQRQTDGVWLLPMDAYVTNDAIVIKADVPGLKADDLSVTLEGETLTIRGEIKAESDQQKFLLRERPIGRFERILTINTPIDSAKVEAHFENGVLTLTLPKAEIAKPRQITIKPK